MVGRQKIALVSVYVISTVQFVWCYLWLSKPYVNTLLYEAGSERMPFQGRSLMMLPLRWAHRSQAFLRLIHLFAKSHFWFPKPVSPEVLMQAAIDVGCLLIAGYFTTRIYQASSKRRLLTPLIYPLFLAAFVATYILHTVQNFRFVYDIPSLAFFSTAMYLIYFRKHWVYFTGIFLIATVNRETTLLLLPLFMLNDAVENGKLQWPLLFRTRTLRVLVPLAVFWVVSQILIRHIYAHNTSEFYPRIDWNIKSLIVPQAWPQLLSACGYLLLFVLVMRQRVCDPQLQAWLWLVPIWCVFMFVYGILIETRIFGELIPLIVSSTALIMEETLSARITALARKTSFALVEPPSDEAVVVREAA
jgi:hypothetical protein